MDSWSNEQVDVRHPESEPSNPALTRSVEHAQGRERGVEPNI